MSKLSEITKYFGPKFPRPYVAVLNSHQGKTPTRAMRWVLNTLSAVQRAIENDHAVLTSVGMNTWEFLTWAVGEFGGKQIIVCPLFSDQKPESVARTILDDFELDSQRTAFLFMTDCSSKPKAFWRDRDQIVVHGADILYPVSIRAGGYIEELIERAFLDEYHPKYIVPDFQTPHQKALTTRQYRFAGLLNEAFDKQEWNYLTHWTHATHEPWFNESRAEFYRALVYEEETYHHSALKSLLRILDGGKIYGSSEYLRQAHRAVSFTELSPAEAVRLVRWHKRKVRYTIEPYGIAIERDFALAMGLQPVIYGDDKVYDSLEPSRKPYFQAQGKKADWRNEKEWRHIGDCDLTKIPPEKIIILVYEPDEIEKVPPDLPFRVMALCE